MHRDWPVSGNEDEFYRYQKDNARSKYICLEGTYFLYKDTWLMEKKDEFIIGHLRNEN